VKNEKLKYGKYYSLSKMEFYDYKHKFKVKTELALYEEIQRNGRLSEESISQRIHIPATTVHYAMERIRDRDFFDIKAMPKLEKFSEIPLGVICFTNVHPVKFQKFRQKFSNMPEIVQFLHDDTDVLLIVMESSTEALTGKLFDIMEHLNEKPCLYITSPKIVKSDMVIPDRILNAVYSDLPSRKSKV
jgi:DNA-binding Lrp family transcriptional regulator